MTLLALAVMACDHRAPLKVDCEKDPLQPECLADAARTSDGSIGTDAGATDGAACGPDLVFTIAKNVGGTYFARLENVGCRKAVVKDCAQTVTVEKLAADGSWMRVQCPGSCRWTGCVSMVPYTNGRFYDFPSPVDSCGPGQFRARIRYGGGCDETSASFTREAISNIVDATK